MILLTGKPCSGKDTIQNELVNIGMKKVVSYTTRPPRKNETDGIAYHFITKKEFKEKEKYNFFAETTSYKVSSGDIWHYGTAMGDLKENKNKVMIVSPYSVKKMKSIGFIKPLVFYIMVNDRTIHNRIKLRGDNPSEIKRRLKDDEQIFHEINNDIDFVIRNDDTYIKPRLLAEMILYTYKKHLLTLYV